MGVVNTTYTFTSTDTITSAKMNNIIDDTTFTSDAIQGDTLQVVSPGKLAVNASGITSNELADGAVVTAKIADGAVTQAKTSNMLLPSGAVMAFAMNSAPSGWLAANGDTIPNGSGTVQGKTENFAVLYSLIGTTYGSAGKLPDLRGYFVRGSGTNSDGTASGTFGAKQSDSFRAHKHNVVRPNSGSFHYVNGSQQWAIGGGFQPYTGAAMTPDDNSLTGGSETRPANIAMLYCIKI
jgi:microcystin-dependent protein